jgi:hypothetical protein
LTATKPQKTLGCVVCTDAAGNELSRQDYYNEQHGSALEEDCKRRRGRPTRIQAPNSNKGATKKSPVSEGRPTSATPPRTA